MKTLAAIYYIKNHCQTMTNEQMAKVLGISDRQVKNIRSKYGLKAKPGMKPGQKLVALCWECANATDYRNCVFVKSCLRKDGVLIYPEGCCTEKGFVLRCPEFKRG